MRARVHVQCIKKVEKVGSKPEALRTLTALGTGAPFAPGDAGWPLGGHFPAPKGAEAGAYNRVNVPVAVAVVACEKSVRRIRDCTHALPPVTAPHLPPLLPLLHLLLLLVQTSCART